jgi:hypothetical protein
LKEQCACPKAEYIFPKAPAAVGPEKQHRPANYFPGMDKRKQGHPEIPDGPALLCEATRWHSN